MYDHYSLLYFDHSGKPINLSEWIKTYEDDNNRFIAQTIIGPILISTVYLGLKDLIFETMVVIRGNNSTFHKSHFEIDTLFPDIYLGVEKYDKQCWRWKNIKTAKAGHQAVCAHIHHCLIADDILPQIDKTLEEIYKVSKKFMECPWKVNEMAFVLPNPT